MSDAEIRELSYTSHNEVEHRWDHFAPQNTANPDLLTSVSSAALFATAKGGKHLFIYLLLQTGRDPRETTEGQHRDVNHRQC